MNNELQSICQENMISNDIIKNLAVQWIRLDKEKKQYYEDLLKNYKKDLKKNIKKFLKVKQYFQTNSLYLNNYCIFYKKEFNEDHDEDKNTLDSESLKSKLKERIRTIEFKFIEENIIEVFFINKKLTDLIDTNITEIIIDMKPKEVEKKSSKRKNKNEHNPMDHIKKLLITK